MTTSPSKCWPEIGVTSAPRKLPARLESKHFKCYFTNLTRLNWSFMIVNYN